MTQRLALLCIVLGVSDAVAQSGPTSDGQAWTVEVPRNVLEGGQTFEGGQTSGVQALAAEPPPGTLYVDRETGDWLREVGTCRYEVGYKLSTGVVKTIPWVLGCLTDPDIAATVTRIDGGCVRYSYRVTNRTSAQQDILLFKINMPQPDILVARTDANGWRAGDLGGSPIDTGGLNSFAWLPIGDTPDLSPGSSVDGLSVDSAWLPGITDAFFVGAVKDETNAGPLQEDIPDYLDAELSKLGKQDKDKAQRPTIGPMFSPPGTDVEARRRLVDQLISDIPKAVSAQFVTSDVAAQVTNILTNVRSHVDDATALRNAASAIGGLSVAVESYRTALVVTLNIVADS